MGNRDLSLLTENFRQKVELWIGDVNTNTTYNIFVTDGFRTKEEQEELYAQGRTKPGNIVTWTLNSEHMKGTAVDIAFYGDELYPENYTPWEVTAVLANKYGIDWGYDLWEKDKPHFQDNGKPINSNLLEKVGIHSFRHTTLPYFIKHAGKVWNETENLLEREKLNKASRAVDELLDFYGK